MLRSSRVHLKVLISFHLATLKKLIVWNLDWWPTYFSIFFGCQRISVLHNSTNKSGIWFTFIALHWNSHLLCISLNCPWQTVDWIKYKCPSRISSDGRNEGADRVTYVPATRREEEKIGCWNWWMVDKLSRYGFERTEEYFQSNCPAWQCNFCGCPSSLLLCWCSSGIPVFEVKRINWNVEGDWRVSPFYVLL